MTGPFKSSGGLLLKQKLKKWRRAYLSTVFGCPYEQNVPVEQVIRLSDTLLEMGVDEISLGDTIGAANPLQVIAVLEALCREFPPQKSHSISMIQEERL